MHDKSIRARRVMAGLIAASAILRDTFIDESGSAAVKGDSVLLQSNRADLTGPQRHERVLATNNRLKEHLLVLPQIKGHS